ncbi:g11176 [Coccomyxa viridis]|uniref:G11176 protein n=1 Tax=Coccomyxa viridis TaxID=1274662 RepID=A0ABP1GEB9_9CHLO
MGSKSPEEIDWSRLDKKKFLFVGAGIFSGLTTCLYPLSVIKTRQMAMDGAPPGFRGAAYVVRQVLATDGIRGLYRGFGIVVVGVIPARGVYLTTLESTKSWSLKTAAMARWAPNEAARAGMASSFAGAVASMVTQSVIVPIDVVSQRLMVAGGSVSAASAGGPNAAALAAEASTRVRASGIQMARHIVQSEGVLGLYRGFGMSIATFVPTSGIWWGAYGAYQKLIWQQVDKWRGASAAELPHRSSEILAVQTASALCAGCTSATLTNPLDVVKTRLQVSKREASGQRPTLNATVRQLWTEQGMKGFTRGLTPRIANAAMWGTCMINAYEFLKRICAIAEDPG